MTDEIPASVRSPDGEGDGPDLSARALTRREERLISECENLRDLWNDVADRSTDEMFRRAHRQCAADLEHLLREVRDE